MGKTNLDCAEPRVLLTSTSGKYVIKVRDMLCWPVPPVPLLGGQEGVAGCHWSVRHHSQGDITLLYCPFKPVKVDKVSLQRSTLLSRCESRSRNT